MSEIQISSACDSDDWVRQALILSYALVAVDSVDGERELVARLGEVPTSESIDEDIDNQTELFRRALSVQSRMLKGTRPG